MLTTVCRKIRDDTDKLAEKHEKTQLALDRASESVRALEDSRKRRFRMYESHLAHKVSVIACLRPIRTDTCEFRLEHFTEKS